MVTRKQLILEALAERPRTGAELARHLYGEPTPNQTQAVAAVVADLVALGVLRRGDEEPNPNGFKPLRRLHVVPEAERPRDDRYPELPAERRRVMQAIATKQRCSRVVLVRDLRLTQGEIEDHVHKLEQAGYVRMDGRIIQAVR